MIHRRHGFTLVELLIVIVVIAILATIAVVAYNGIQDRAHLSKASSALRQAEQLIRMYTVEQNALPGGTCIGSETSYKAKPPFDAGNCIVGTEPNNLSVKTSHYGPVYSSAINNALGTNAIDAEWPPAEEVYPGSYAMVNRGIYWSTFAPYQSGWLGFVVEGNKKCPNEVNRSYEATSDVTYCRINIRI